MVITFRPINNWRSLIVPIMVLVCRLTAPLQAQEPTGQFVDHSVKIDDADYKYVVFVPASYRAEQASPAILFLHSAGERGADNRMHLTEGLAPFVQARAKSFPFLVVFPQCSNDEDRILTAWQSGSPNSRRALAALEDAQRRYQIDAKRITLSGWSMGAYGAWSLGMADPSRWSAIVPIAGGGDASRVGTLKDVPVWAFHGAKDTLVKIESERQMVEALKAAGGTATLTEFPEGAHRICDIVYGCDALFKWMLDPRKTPTELGSATAKPVAAINVPFVPAVEIPSAAAVRLGNDALSAMSYSLPQFVPKDMLTGRLNDMFDSTVAEGRQFSIRFSGISYAGQLERVITRGYGKDRILVQLGLRNVTLTIGGTSIVGERHSAQAGPINIVLGHRAPVWLSLELTPFIEDRKLRLKQRAVGFQIPNDNWYVTQPAGVSVRGFGMTEDAVVSGLTNGLYGSKSRIENEVVSVVPGIIKQIEKNLVLPDSGSTVSQSGSTLTKLWPLPINPPRMQFWPEQISADEDGISLVVGMTAASMDPFGPAKPMKKRESSGITIEQLPQSRALQVKVAPQLLEPLTELAVDANQLKLDLLDIPRPLFAKLADRSTLQEVIPDLKRHGEGLQVRTSMRVIQPLSIGEASQPQAADQIKPLEFRVNGLLMSVQIKQDGTESQWTTCATFVINVTEQVQASLVKPAHDQRQISVNLLPTTKITATGGFAPGYEAKDNALNTDRYVELFKSAWQSFSSGISESNVDVPDLEIGASKLRLQDVAWTSSAIDVTFRLARVKLSNLSEEPFTYETKAPTSSWGEPLTLKPGESHEFDIPYPLTYRRQTKAGPEIYTLNVGTHSEFRVPLTGGAPRLFSAKRQ